MLIARIPGDRVTAGELGAYNRRHRNGKRCRTRPFCRLPTARELHASCSRPRWQRHFERAPGPTGSSLILTQAGSADPAWQAALKLVTGMIFCRFCWSRTDASGPADIQGQGEECQKPSSTLFQWSNVSPSGSRNTEAAGAHSGRRRRRRHVPHGTGGHPARPLGRRPRRNLGSIAHALRNSWQTDPAPSDRL